MRSSSFAVKSFICALIVSMSLAGCSSTKGSSVGNELVSGGAQVQPAGGGVPAGGGGGQPAGGGGGRGQPGGGGVPAGGGGGGQPAGSEPTVDLMWAEIIMTDSNDQPAWELTVGQPVNIYAAMYNDGDAQARNIRRSFYVDGALARNDFALRCDPRASSAFITRNYIFDRPGTHELTFNIGSSDPAESVAQMANNVARFTVEVKPVLTHVGAPPPATVNTNENHDLKVDQVFYSYDGQLIRPPQSSVQLNIPGKIYAPIINHANYNEGNVEVSIKVNGRSIPGGQITIDRIDANGYFDVKVPYQFREPGSYTISAEIDPNHRLRQEDRNGNYMERIVSVEGSIERDAFIFNQDIRPLNIKFLEYNEVYTSPAGQRENALEVTRTEVGKKGSLVGTFYNTSNISDVSGIKATIFVDGVQVGHPETLAIRRGEIAMIEKTNYSFDRPGIKQMTLQLDVQEDVEDDDRLHNDIERSIQVDGEEGIRVIPSQPEPLTVVPTATSQEEVDLIADSISFWRGDELTSTDGVFLNETGRVKFIVREYDDKAVNNVPVEIRFMLGEQAVYIFPFTINLRQGERTVGWTQPTSFSRPGHYEMILWVDPNGTIPDSRPNSNDFHRSLTVTGPTAMMRQAEQQQAPAAPSSNASSAALLNFANDIVGALGGLASDTNSWTPTATSDYHFSPPTQSAPAVSTSAPKPKPVLYSKTQS